MKYSSVVTKVLIAVVVALSCGFVWKAYRLMQAQNAYEVLVNEFEAYKINAQIQVQQEEQRRIEELKEVEQYAQERIDEIQNAADVASADAHGLREELARIRESSNTSITADSKAARAYIGVLTELLGECTEKYASVAQQADRSRSAGLACEAAYEAIRGNVAQPL